MINTSNAVWTPNNERMRIKRTVRFVTTDCAPVFHLACIARWRLPFRHLPLRPMSQILQTLSDKLYESLLTPDEWPQALDLLRKTLDGVVYHHFTVHKDTREVVSSVISETVNPKHLAEYEQHLGRLDPRIPLIMKTPLGGVMWDHQHLSQAEIERHPVYAEFLKPQGYRHTVAIPLQDVGNTREVLAIVRAHDQRPFDLSHDLLVLQP